MGTDETLSLELPWPPSINQKPACEVSEGGVYAIVDKHSGRFYIGSSVNIAKRWRHHVYRFNRGDHPNPIMQAIWNSDADRLVCVLVDVCASSQDGALLQIEQQYLDRSGVGTNRMCMNVLSVAGSHFGRKRTDETKRRLSMAKTGLRHTDEAKEKMRQAKTGRALSDSHKKAIGEKSRGRPGPRHSAEALAAWRKLSTESVASIRSLHKSGIGTVALSRRFGCSRATVRRILKGESYCDA
jgi:group I intron endonuclease